MPKSHDDSKLSRGISRSNDCSSHGRELYLKWKSLLELSKLQEKLCIWSIGHRRIAIRIFVFVESRKTLVLVHDFTCFVEQHSISIECDTDLTLRSRSEILWGRFQYCGSTDRGVGDSLGVLLVGGQKQVDLICVKIWNN